MSLRVRRATPADRPSVVAIARELVSAADTYAFDPLASDDQLWQYFAPDSGGLGYVAEADGQVVGCFVIRPNHPGPGSHVANASFAVSSAARGQGIGRAMGEAALTLAADSGYRAMQFNIVVSSNRAAVALWRSLGFRVIATVPEGFRLPDGTLVDHLVMHRPLEPRNGIDPVDPAGFGQQVTFLPVSDLSTSAAFYGQVLGLDLVLDQGDCRIYRVAADAFVGICERDARATDGLMLTLVTGEVDRWHDRLVAAGVVCDRPPAHNAKYNLYHGFYRDPDGHVIEVQTFLDPNWR
ncbi:MAG: GNAT family N-acetyltransferase [Acidimicrobiales bacterium]